MSRIVPRPAGPDPVTASPNPGYWGILSDAHGNPDGLMACVVALRERGAGRMLFLGDAVGYLPLEAVVLDVLAAESFECICGNHDAMLLGRIPIDATKDAVYGLHAARTRLSPTHRAGMARWPRERVLTGVGEGGGSVLLVHGGPDDPWHQYVHPDSALDGFAASRHRAVFIGQTHRPFVRRAGATLVVNAGSCGLPRDVGNLASCVLYDPLSNQADILRIPFDADAVLERAARVAEIDPSVRECLRRRATTVEGVQAQGR